MGIRSGQLDLLLGSQPRPHIPDAIELCHLKLGDVAEGVVMGLPLTPNEMTQSQDVALKAMINTINGLSNVQAVGLGSLCAVIAGRGEGLSTEVATPITTGSAATAWALLENIAQLHDGGPIAIVGSRSPVGQVVADTLVSAGWAVRVDSPRTAHRLGLAAHDSLAQTIRGATLIVGAGTTGGILDPQILPNSACLIDVAIPSTLSGPPPRGVCLYSGEALTAPKTWVRGGWGSLYHLLSGYGYNQVYACLAEALVMAVTGRTQPFSIGRSIDPESVKEFGHTAKELGFRPTLVRDRRWTFSR